MKIFRIVALLALVASGVVSAQESKESFWAGFRQEYKAACTPEAWKRDGDSCSARLAENLRRERAEREAVEERQRQALAISVQTAAEVWERADAKRVAEQQAKVAADAQLQAHLQQVAARKAWEWQSHLWLWEAQRQAQAQQQYQQQLLQQLQRQDVGHQWFQRDLVRAIEGLAPAPANCWYSYVQHRHVCY